MAIYKPAEGSHLTEEQAQAFGDRLEHLADQHGGVTVNLLVRDAANTESPFHEYFEWDDKKAATLYRERQARYILRSVCTLVRVNGGEPKLVRAWHPVTREEVKPRKVYVGVKQVLSNRDDYAETVKNALAQLKSWRDKYKTYKEFNPVHEAITLVESQLD